MSNFKDDGTGKRCVVVTARATIAERDLINKGAKEAGRGIMDYIVFLMEFNRLHREEK